MTIISGISHFILHVDEVLAKGKRPAMDQNNNRQGFCIATSAAVSATQAASTHRNKHRFAQKNTTFPNTL